jgi:hypothetical protein
MVREEQESPAASDPSELEHARRIALSVNRAASFGVFRPRCLVRSIALRRLLNAADIRGATVRFGVRLDDGEFTAHAWVEYGGVVVGDDPAHIARYIPMTGMQVAELE